MVWGTLLHVRRQPIDERVGRAGPVADGLRLGGRDLNVGYQPMQPVVEFVLVDVWYICIKAASAPTTLKQELRGRTRVDDGGGAQKLAGGEGNDLERGLALGAA